MRVSRLCDTFSQQQLMTFSFGKARMFGLFRSNDRLRISTGHHVLQKDRPTGEKEIFELAHSAKHEGSWAHVSGADVWINLTQNYRKEISDTAVKYQVTSRPLANSIFDAGLIFYHTHPKSAFDAAFKMMTRARSFNLHSPLNNDLIEQRAYGHLLSTFHLPSVQDIEAAAYLEEKHGPGTFHVIISNVGATITRIRNPPDGEGDKTSVDEIVSNYRIAHGSIPSFDGNRRGSLMQPHYGQINERCKGRVTVVDLTSAASTTFHPEHHLLMRWLSSNVPLRKRLDGTSVTLLLQMFGEDNRRFSEFEQKVKNLTEKGDNASELKRLSESLHEDVAELLIRFVGAESAAVYAEYTVRALRDFYACVERRYTHK